MKRRIVFLLTLVMLGCQKFVLTDEEKSWIARYPVIRLAPDPDFPPFEFFDKFGQYQGIGSDFVKEFSHFTGIRVEVVRYSSWSEVLRALSNRQIDIINCAIDTPARRAYAIFPTPYLSLPNVVVTRKTMPEDVGLQEVLRLKVGMVRGYGMVDILKEKYPDFSPVLYPTLFDGFRALVNEEVDYFLIDIGTASYYITEGGFYSLKIVSSFKPDNIMGFGVRSDWPILVDIIEKFQKSLPESRKQQIIKKWVIVGQRYLTTERWRGFLWGLFIVVVLASLVVVGILWRVRLRHTEFQRRQEVLSRQLTEMIEMLPIVLDRLPIGAMIVEKDGSISYVNSVYVDIFGQKAEEVKTFYNFYQSATVLDSDRRLLWEKWENVVTYRRAHPYILLEHFLLKDVMGRQHPCRVDIHRLGEKFLLTFMDYSDKEAMNKEAQYRKNQFHLMLKEKDMLFMELEHRVRNTLQMVLSFIRLHMPLISCYSGDQLLRKLSCGVDLLGIAQNYTMHDVSLRLYGLKVPLMEFLYHFKGEYGIEVETDIDDIEVNSQSLLALLFLVEEVLFWGYLFDKKEGWWKISFKKGKKVFLVVESEHVFELSEKDKQVCQGFISQLGGTFFYTNTPHFLLKVEMDLKSLQCL